MKSCPFLLAKAIGFVLVVLLAGAYQFANSHANLVQAQMMTIPPTASPTPNNDQTILIVLFAVVIVAIALIAAVLFLLYSRKKKIDSS
jgi:hypothetical protein